MGLKKLNGTSQYYEIVHHTACKNKDMPDSVVVFKSFEDIKRNSSTIGDTTSY